MQRWRGRSAVEERQNSAKRHLVVEQVEEYVRNRGNSAVERTTAGEPPLYQPVKESLMGANADKLRTLYDAIGAGDVATVLGAMDDKIDWQEPTGMPYENQVGPQAVAENILGPVTTQLEGFSATPNEIIDGGDIIVAIGRYGGKGAANGVDLDAEFVHVWRFGPDGKITGFRTYTDTYLWRQALGAD